MNLYIKTNKMLHEVISYRDTKNFVVVEHPSMTLKFIANINNYKC